MGRFRVDGSHRDGPPASFEVHSPSEGDARRAAEAAGIAVLAVFPEGAVAPPPPAPPPRAAAGRAPRPRAVVALVLSAGVAAFLSALDAREPQIVLREVAVGFALRAVGGAVAVVGLAGVLGQWHAGAGAGRLYAGGVVILAGLAVASQSWAATLGLAGVLAAARAFPGGSLPDAGPDAVPDSTTRSVP